jgi:hypothetical protein
MRAAMQSIEILAIVVLSAIVAIVGGSLLLKFILSLYNFTLPT